jgi:hypothetical protein
VSNILTIQNIDKLNHSAEHKIKIRTRIHLHYLKNILGKGNVGSYLSKLTNLLNVLRKQHQEYSLTTIKPFKLHIKEKHLEGVSQL